MARYMSSKERENFVLCAVMRLRYEKLLKEIADKTPNQKELIKALKYVVTYADKACNAILDGKDEYEQAHAIEKGKKYNFLIKYNDEAKREYDRLKADVDAAHLPNDKYRMLITLALANCSACDVDEEDIRECPYRKILVDLDVNEVDMNSKCKFRYEKKESV